VINRNFDLLYGRYADFWQVTQDSLEFAAKMLKLELTDERRQRLAIKILLLRSTFPFVNFVLFCSIQKSGPAAARSTARDAYTTGGEPDLLIEPFVL
jgi:hypothetical protein